MKGGITMNVLEIVQAPKALIEVARMLFNGLHHTVHTIIFDNSHPLSEHSNKLGCFIPSLNTVVIYLGGCLQDAPQYMARGLTYHAAVWYSMLYALYHEAAHAEQWQTGAKKITAALEKEADEEAEIQVAYDVMYAPELALPKLEEMGWAGKCMFNMMNNLLLSSPKIVEEMLQFNGHDIGGLAPILFRINATNEETTKRWLKTAEEEKLGTKVNGKLYLTFLGAIGAMEQERSQA
jgi:hypothetical protein